MKEVRAVLTIANVDVGGVVELPDEPGEFVIFRPDHGGIMKLRRQLVQWIVKG